ncbi:MAG: DUF993 family protein [Gammaproteobacteria bacterium]
MESCLEMLRTNAAKIDKYQDFAARRRQRDRYAPALAAGVQWMAWATISIIWELIAGDGEAYSDALLGIFDVIAPAAGAALAALAQGDLASTTRFSSDRAIVAPYLPSANALLQDRRGVHGVSERHQHHFAMVGGQQSARSALHLSDIFRLADRAGLLRDPELPLRAW